MQQRPCLQQITTLPVPLLAMMALCISVQPAAAALDYGALPGPDDNGGLSSLQSLQLELVVNGVHTGMIVPVTLSSGRFALSAADLAQAGIAPGEGWGSSVVVSDIEGTSVDYDVANQRLQLAVPPGMLQRRYLNPAARQREPARASFGALFNYDLYVSDRDGNAPGAALWNEFRLFGPAGAASSTGVLRRGERGGKLRFTRFDSRWIRSDENRMITYEAGDVITRGLPWSGAVRLGGVQVSRDFSVRPDVVTFPLPEFAGAAKLPSTVELFIDGYRAARGDIASGPFLVNAPPGLSGAGEATIAVTDAVGRRVTATLPFYVSSALLRRGLFDFSVAAGALRRNYGRRSFDYGAAAGTASLRYGASSWLTLEGHAEATRGLALAGAGAIVRLGNAGVVNASYVRSARRGDSGGELAFGYQYQARRFSVAMNHVRSDPDFFDLGRFDENRRQSRQTRNSIVGSLSAGRPGTFSAGYFASKDRAGERARLASVSWSVPVARGVLLYASGARELERRDWSASLNLIVPLGGRRGSASAGYARGFDGSSVWRAEHARAIPSDGGFGWSAGVARYSDAGAFGQGELSWRNQAVELRAGAFGGDGHRTAWASARGSLVLMDRAVFAANRVPDAFVLVSTNGEPDIPIRYENQLVGRTGKGGHLLVPWVTAFYAAKYEIDPLDLPAEIATPVVERRIAVARGSGYLLSFPVRRPVSARITLVDAAQAPLPVGSVARVNDGAPLYVGWDGLLFAEDLAKDNVVAVTGPDGSACTVRFSMATTRPSVIAEIVPLTCR